MEMVADTGRQLELGGGRHSGIRLLQSSGFGDSFLVVLAILLLHSLSKWWPRSFKRYRLPDYGSPEGVEVDHHSSRFALNPSLNQQQRIYCKGSLDTSLVGINQHHWAESKAKLQDGLLLV